jgi:hypothetical protein
MRLFLGVGCAVVALASGLPEEASAACCYTAPPVHVYVPPPTHVVIVPHTTFVHPTTSRVNTSHLGSTPSLQTGHAKPPPHPHTAPTVVVDNQATPTNAHCKRPQGGGDCKKKDDDQTGWATVRRWLQIGKQ